MTYNFQASSCGVPLVCGAGPHPSTRLEGMIGGEGASEAAMMAQVKVKVLVLVADTRVFEYGAPSLF